MASRSILPIIRQAIAGDAASQCRLGRVYLDGGEGLAANQAMAYLWLSRAAAQGRREAWELIGSRLDLRAAGGDSAIVRWLELSAAEGCVPAQAKLGRLLLQHGHPGPLYSEPAPGRAEALLRSAALQGCADACLDLGRHLLESAPKGSDCAEACHLLDRAYREGHAAAARLLADHYWAHRDLDSALAWYRRCDDRADAEVRYRMGLLHCMLGLPAESLLEQAASAGHPLACEELGAAYAIGLFGGTGIRPTNRRLKKAARWLERAASLGSLRACHLLGMLYRHPKSDMRDPRKARHWQWQAACRGHAEAALRTAMDMLDDLAAGREPHRHFPLAEDPEVIAFRFLALAEGAGYAEAGNALRGLSPNARPAKVADEDWASAIAAARGRDRNLALRLRLGRCLHLTAKELLLVDPCSADRGDCFVVDIRPGKLRRRRILRIDRQEQRDVIDEAKQFLGAETAATADWRSAYRARYGRLRRLCRQARAGGNLFPRASGAPGAPRAPARAAMESIADL